MATDPNQEIPETSETEILTDTTFETANSEAEADPLEARLQTLETQFQEWASAFTSYIGQIEQDTKLNSQLTQHTERRFYEVSQTQLEIGKVHESLVLTASQLGGLEQLETLRQEHKNILNTLENLQIGNQRLHELQGETLRAEERLSQTQQRVEEINHLVATAQAELVKQAMALTKDLQQRYASLVSGSSISSSTAVEPLTDNLAVADPTLDSRIAAFSQMQVEVNEAIQTLQQLLSQAQTKPSQVNSEVDGDLAGELEFSFEEPIIEYNPEPEEQTDINTGAKLTLEQVRAELYGIAQQAKMDKEALQREQKQKLKSLEQKQQGLKTWLLGLTIGTVLALGLGTAALLIRFALKS